MKHLKSIFGTFLMTALLFTSCTKNDDGDILIRPSAEDFNELKETALENLTQNFQFDATDGGITLTSEKGVNIYINTNCLTLNGNIIGVTSNIGDESGNSKYLVSTIFAE